MLEKTDFYHIGKYLFDDLNDLASLCSPEKSDEEDEMRALSEHLRDI